MCTKPLLRRWARLAEAVCLTIFFDGTFFSCLFAELVVLPTIAEHHPHWFWPLTVLLLYGYANVNVLWVLLRITDTRPPLSTRPPPAVLECDEDFSDVFDKIFDVDYLYPPIKEEVAVCEKCGCEQPPRSHHCLFCRMCVEVHDHHCLFVGRCIGRRNSAYFANFCFWWIFCFVVSLPLLFYYYFWYWPEDDEYAARWFDLPFPPVVHLRFCLGYISWRSYGIVLMIQTFWGIFNSALVMAVGNVYATVVDKTPYELHRQTEAVWPTDWKTVWRRLLDVYGNRFWLSWLAPTVLLFDGKPRHNLYDAFKGVL